MHRRLFPLGLAAAACGCAARARAQHGAEWGYAGPGGPEHWSELSQAYRVCAGVQESPIDLRDAVPAQLGPLAIDWPATPLRVVNTGHSIQLDTVTSGGTLVVDGRRFQLVQFHLHHPSEHLLAGRRFPMELHFVHRAAAGDTLAVVAVFVAAGAVNAALEPILANMPTEHGQVREVPGVVRPADLLPAGRTFYRYEGSLTTPPCSENVDWIVLADPIEASAGQVAALERVFAMNARPLQALNRRFLLRSEQ